MIARCWFSLLILIVGCDEGSTPSSTSALSLSSGDDETCAILAVGTAPDAGTSDVGGDASIDAGIPGAPAAGVVSCWGAGRSTPTLRSEALPRAIALAWGDTRCVTPATGPVVCWGANDRGQLTTTPSFDVATPSALRGLTRPQVQVARFGGAFVCALDAGQVFCWGAGTEGQLGNGGRSDRAQAEPVALPAGAAITGLGVGSEHACAITEMGLYCWGANSSGQIGDGSRTDAVSPRLVGTPGMGTIRGLALGRAHSCALDDVGAVWCWGDDEFGQVGQRSAGVMTIVPRQVARLGAVSMIASGADHICAVESEGPVRCWGRNDEFQTAHPNPVSLGQMGHVGLSGARQLSLGESHSCALMPDGVFCWGASDASQLGRPGTNNSLLPQRVLGLP